MEDGAEEFSLLVGGIYDAAIDPTSWPSVLQGVARYVQGDFCLLISEDAVASQAHIHYTSRDETAWLEAYFAKYIHLNPTLVPAMLNAKVGDSFSASTYLPYEEFVTSRFFKEWVRPKGFVDVVSVAIERSTTSLAFLAVLRREIDGQTDEDAHRRMRLVAPHVRRSVAIARLLELNRFEAGAFSDTLDGLAAGVFLVDRGARIIHVNRAARLLLEEAAVFRDHSGVLDVIDEAAMRALREAFVAAAEGDATLGTRGVAVAVSGPGDVRFMAHVLPLTSGTRRQAGVMYDAVAAVFVRTATLDIPSPLEGLAELYRLSPRELSVLLAIVETGGVPAVAALLGLTQATVKGYLKSVFQKTGTKRQADLVKLVAGLANPFTGARDD